ncbi:hypothetical protein [Fluviispira multicolorata]|uniref:Uncharacterized protein n=1 Tax=Fluviispira multicolorata TaxID=2654512 RepID=A0A833JC26_9BACT|nr:hypothetical protein [Fluviispira multicolorata]KAB8029043.1 hypothetical protein GCL57_10905 [Fluviispira multicolorata]
MVNNENSFLLINQEITDLPYLECLKFIVRASYGLIESGEALFIDFIHAQHISLDNNQKNQIDKLINQFDFTQGTPVSRQVLSLFMLKYLFYESNDIIQKIKKSLVEKTKLNLNKISEQPSFALRAYRALLLLENTKNIKEEFFLYEEKLNQFLTKLSGQKITKKEDFNAPLSFWEEESIRILMYKILSLVECAIHSYMYIENMKDNKVTISLISIKEEILDSTIENLFNKIHLILKLTHLIIRNNKNQHKIIDENKTRELENIFYLNRLGIQLSKLNENISEIQKLQQKMSELNTGNIKFREMIDEEIQSLNMSISKDNITTARLEMRLNDEEYPLSVAFRNHITKMLQCSEN